MIELSLSRETVALLGANMESHFQMPILQAGLAIYQSGKVTHIWKDQFNIIHAIVGGEAGTDHKLQIDLDVFLASECLCGERFCPHMAAVFFMLYQEHAVPERWLSDVGSSLTEAKEHSEPTLTNPSGTADAGSKPLSLQELPDNWSRMLDKELDLLYRRQTDRFRIDIFYYTAFKKLGAFAEALPDKQKPYYRAFCALKLMLHAESHLMSHADDYPGPYAHRVALDLNDHFMEKLRDAVNQIGLSDQQGEQLACKEAISHLLMSVPVSSQTAFHWVEIHRFLWTHLLLDPDVRELESIRLTQAASVAVSTEAAGKLAMMAAHIDWLLGRDEAAMAKLAAPLLPVSGLVVTYLDTHAKTGSWTRLGNWLDFSLPHLRRASTDAFNKSLAIWRDYARHTHDDSSFRHALSALLPRSYNQYSEYLIKTARYGEWVSFHLLNGIAPGKIDRTQLKEVENKNPALALPIYHHAVERLLASRNRTAYREIVKLLKRMKETYTAAGEVSRFREFMDGVAARYQRLHAFMEELQKGKLLG